HSGSQPVAAIKAMLLKTRKYSAFDFRAESLSQLRSRRRAVPASHDSRSDSRGGGGGGRPGQLALVLEEEEPQQTVEKPAPIRKRRVSFIMPHSGDVIQVQQKQFNSWGTQTAEYNSISNAVMSEAYYVSAMSALQQRLQMYQLMAQDVADHMRRRQQLHRLRRERQQLESTWRNVFTIISFVTSLCMLFLALRISVGLALEVLLD
uniref:GOLD domain-containing protein n=1 Tax=Macrostomum lignano TaxID=282301 RepID=A0A1I8GVX0_9PLAT